MLPTPDTSHVPYSRVYEPAEDSFLLIDTLASESETAFLQARFGSKSRDNGKAVPSSSLLSLSSPASAPPLVVEVGSGSGVVIAFVVAQAAHLFGSGSSTAGLLALAVDMNAFACQATNQTVQRAVVEEQQAGSSLYLGASRADLASALRPGQVDVLLFNPPYVPTPEGPPSIAAAATDEETGAAATPGSSAIDSFARDSRLLELAYAGGHDGMETTDRLLAALPELLSPRGCAYVLLCAQNRPEEVKERVRQWPVTMANETEEDAGAKDSQLHQTRPHRLSGQWQAETVGTSGRQAGWEKLQIVRIWREWV